ncbi:Rieske (2Fe-2S) protein [Halorubrum sp. DTA98]|uniref:Rieske (2Fe-2S) protein n=1 Tax=Halorubrum sp. DTA98 TaxID=3402163 RepID=UPI003AABB4F1
MDADRRIVAVEEVPEDGTLLVTIRPLDPDAINDGEGDVGEDEDGTPEAEAMLIRLADGVSAFRNYCRHWMDVRLDKGEGAFVRDGEIFCQKHGATFEADSGYCTFGPCEGSVLERVDVAVDDGAVYLVDDAYAFVRVGPATRNESAGDSRIDFTGN